MADQQSEAVIVRVKLSDDEFGEPEERMNAYRVEDRLLETIPTDIGEVDGHDFGGGFFTVYVYGPSAEGLAALVLPALQTQTVRPGSTIIKRFGPPGAREEAVNWPAA